MSRFHPLKPGVAAEDGTGQLIRVSDSIYCANDYAISNVVFVVTDSSLVVVDTTESTTAAQAALADMRQICTLPISHIIYTHCHGDHIRGARAFHSESTTVIAQRRLLHERARLQRLGPFMRRLTAVQFGLSLDPDQRTVTLINETESGYVPPDTVFDEEYTFETGDLRFELYHTEGETPDHLMVWIPELRALLPGDLYYNSFPMLSNPLRGDRPPLEWAESLERMRALQPAYLVPSHSPPVAGSDAIDELLGNYARAIRSVHDQTLERINRGVSLERIRAQVKLPSDLAELTYLREYYGTVAWSAQGIVRQYTGWCGFNPVDLNPAPRARRQQAILEANGGPAALVRRARRALGDAQYQLALELADIVIGARPWHRAAHAITARALRHLANASENGVEQNIYHTAAHGAERWLIDPFNLIAGTRRHRMFSRTWSRPARYVRMPDSPARSVRPERIANLQQQTCGYWLPATRSHEEARENLIDELLAFLPDRSGTILDITSGVSSTTRHLLRYYPGECVTAVEPSTHLTTIQDASFDNVLCLESPFRRGSRAPFVHEVSRVLKPGGRLIMSDSVTADTVPRAYRRLFFNAGFARLELVDATDRCSTAFRRYTLRQLREAVQAGTLERPTFRQRREALLAAERASGYYLLVCAQKPATE